MGRKLDLSGLTDSEAEHVLQVVQRDMRLRKKEEERLSELKQELDEEGSRCLLLSRQSCFNQRCCIRCCSPFTFLLNPKRQCRDCHYNVCKACRVYNKQDKAWLCSACQKSRLLKTQSLEWFYTNVKKRFKRFGSAKVLKTLYRKHLAEHSALSELTEGSAYEESICNEGSVCGSDSTFYRQTEEHSMAETLTVAMRVAEEAIDEAISKAEFDTSSQEKQNEAHYLREHRGELIEELAKTIVQKIISRRKTLAEMRAEYDQDLPLERNTDLHHHHQPACDQTSSSLKHRPSLWRSHSAFSLLDNDPPSLVQDSSQALKKEGGGSTMTTWKSVDRLDNAGVSSVLKSVDGNWIALQSAQLSRPSLLTKRKSQVYSALERESGVVSAYEGLGSDNETKPEPDSTWGAVLQKIHRKMTDSNFNLHDSGDRSPSSPMGRRGSRNDVLSDSEGKRKPNKPLLALLKRKMPAEIRRPSSSQRTSIIDVNFNVEVAGGAEQEEEEVIKVAAEPETGKVRRRKRRTRKEPAAASNVSDLNKNDNHTLCSDDARTPDTLTSGSTTPEPSEHEGDLTATQMDEGIMLNPQKPAGRVSGSSTREEELDEVSDTGNGVEMEQSKDRHEEDESLWKMEVELDRGRTEDEEENETDDEEVKYRLYRLVAQSRLAYFSSTDDELDKAGQSEGEWDKDEDMEEEDEKAERLTYKLCQLEKEVRAAQFSSTEDELDRIGIEERENGEEEEDGRNEELAVKVCRLTNQVNATQFSSTEDELDRAGKAEDEIDEVTLWKLQAEQTVQAAKLRDLASLVSASQFSSTEDELDRVGEGKGEIEQEVDDRGMESRSEGGLERRESFGDIDVNMFDLWDEIEERKKESSDEEVARENVFDSETKTEDVEHDESEENKLCNEVSVTEDKKIARGHSNDGQIFQGDEAGKEKAKEEETESKTGVEVERMTRMIDLHEAKVQQENQPEAKRTDDEKGDEKYEKDSKKSVGRRETAADSDEEDAEFSRIISSMLMMTLEDMQVESVKDNAGENRGRHREHKMGRESGCREKASEETEGVSKELQSFSEKSESVVQKRPGEYVSEETERHISGKQSTDVTGRTENVQEDRQMSLLKEKPAVVIIKDTFETNEAELTSRRTEVDDEDKQDGRAEWQLMETQGDTRDRQKKDLDGRVEETKDDVELSSTSCLQSGLLTPEEIHNGSDTELYKTIEFISTLLEQRYSAVSLRSITTEVLKVLNATEELLQGVEGGDNGRLSASSLPPDTNPSKLDQQFSRLEENVYVAAGSVYSLEAELSDLEECARGICSSTSDMELSFLEEQVAAAAAKVQQSELQISDISARIAALRSAGLNVDAQSRFTKTKTLPVMPVTLDSSKQIRRRLPAPPVKDKET
ncbi:rab effector MyRIP-like isoform X2 [Acanthochromis polyacanthus]|uniref:rab effector MyRIP-like isoform X2 n=1 Tax=Acanthochromis polyacanthus TaxID=80966 RepID=UPI0022348347|nr:rab effector MyRIP-like isoform X2 [Acanthochromis polyacanthus]